MPFGVTPIDPTIPRAPPEFSEFIQFQSDGDPLSGPTVQVVNILSPLTATRGVGENAHVVTISRPDIPFIFVSLTGVQAAGEVGDVESDPPLFYVPFTGDVANDVTANPAPATVGATAVISGNAFLSINPISTTSGISWTSAKLQGLTSGDFTMSGTFKWAAIAFASFRRIMRLDFGNGGTAQLDIGFHQSSGQVVVDVQGASEVISSGLTSPNVTHTFALTVARSGTNTSGLATLYIDNVSVGTATVLCPVAPSTVTVSVGNTSDQGSEDYAIDDLRLWNSQRP